MSEVPARTCLQGHVAERDMSHDAHVEARSEWGAGHRRGEGCQLGTREAHVGQQGLSAAVPRVCLDGAHGSAVRLRRRHSANVERLIVRAHPRERQDAIAKVIYEGRLLDRDRILEFGTCGFMEYHRDVILEGFIDAGKTWLACALARRACRHGYNAMYVCMPYLLLAREERLASGRSESKLLRKYSNFGMLVLDERLIDPLAPERGRFVFGLVESGVTQRPTSAVSSISSPSGTSG